jgi:hypothetical protein
LRPLALADSAGTELVVRKEPEAAMKKILSAARTPVDRSAEMAAQSEGA